MSTEMKPYADTNHDSNVLAYRIEDTSIVIQFKNGTNQYYEYTNSSAGSSNIELMKSLAQEGDGLNSFISKNKPSYASKW